MSQPPTLAIGLQRFSPIRRELKKSQPPTLAIGLQSLVFLLFMQSFRSQPPTLAIGLQSLDWEDRIGHFDVSTADIGDRSSELFLKYKVGNNVSTADIGDRSSETLKRISNSNISSQPPTLAIGLQRRFISK